MKKAALCFILSIVTFIIMAATATQVNDYENGNVLTAGELNSEFGNIYSTLNNLDYENFAPGTTLPPTIIDSIIAGLGLSQDPGTGALDINADGTSLEIVLDTLGVKEDGITAAELAPGAVGTTELADNSVTSVKIADGNVNNADLANNAVTSAKIQDGQVANADLANNAVNSAKIQDGSVSFADRTSYSSTTGSGGPQRYVRSNTQIDTILASDGAGNGSASVEVTYTRVAGEQVLVKMGAFNGPTQFLCIDRDQQLDVTLVKLPSTEVSRWRVDYNAIIQGVQVSGGISMISDYTYFDTSTSAGTTTYRYTISTSGGQPSADNCILKGLNATAIGFK